MRSSAQLRSARGFRAEADTRNEKIGLKIREAEKAKIPYMLVVGEREMEAGTVSVRGRSGANLGTLPIAGLIDLIAERHREDAPTPIHN